VVRSGTAIHGFRGQDHQLPVGVFAANISGDGHAFIDRALSIFHRNGPTIAIEFKRRIKTQTVLPSANTAAMLFQALLASPDQHAQG
jgi:hypothetical protein